MSPLPELGRRGEGWFLLQLVLLAAVAAAGIFLGPDWSGAPRFAAAIAGGALLAAGIGLAVMGVRDLDASLSPLPRPRDDGTLVEHGVYRRVRHPIYFGVGASAFGWGLLTASGVALLLALALILLLDLKARREEAWLMERYPAYADYARRTRRFVPGIY